MCRVTIHDSARAFRLRLQGEISRACLLETELCWRTAASTIAGREFVVDLAGVLPEVDAARSLLAEMYRAGARLVASTQEAALLVAEVTGQPPAPAAAPRRRLPGWLGRWLGKG